MKLSFIDMARRAGLDKALESYPADVEAAAADAEHHAAELARPADMTVEPYPPIKLSSAQ